MRGKRRCAGHDVLDARKLRPYIGTDLAFSLKVLVHLIKADQRANPFIQIVSPTCAQDVLGDGPTASASIQRAAHRASLAAQRLDDLDQVDLVGQEGVNLQIFAQCRGQRLAGIRQSCKGQQLAAALVVEISRGACRCPSFCGETVRLLRTSSMFSVVRASEAEAALDLLHVALPPRGPLCR